jgi:hypothetical protein
VKRSDNLATTRELKLYGMKAAFDEIVATAVKRQHDLAQVHWEQHNPAWGLMPQARHTQSRAGDVRDDAKRTIETMRHSEKACRKGQAGTLDFRAAKSLTCARTARNQTSGQETIKGPWKPPTQEPLATHEFPMREKMMALS